MDATPIPKHDVIRTIGRAIVSMSPAEREAVLRAKQGVRTLFLGDRRVEGDHIAEDEAPRLRATLRQAVADALEETGQSLAPVDDLTALAYDAAGAVHMRDRPLDADHSDWARDWRKLVAPFQAAVP